MPRRSSLIFGLSAVLGSLVAGEARGEPPVEAVHVMYDADLGCPDGAKFVEQILARTRKASMAGPSGARRTFVVTVRSRDEATFAGRLEIRSANEATTNRDVTGPTCAAVTTALALIAALAIDPDSARAEPLVAEPPTTPPRADAGSAASTSPPERSEPSGPPSANTWRWRMGAQGEGDSAMAPSLAFGGSAFAEVVRWDAGIDEAARAAVGLAALRLGVHYAGTGTIRREGGAATFDRAAIGVEACLFRIRIARRADARACAAFDAGVLRAHGAEIPLPATPIRGWFSVAPILRMQWFVGASWFLNAEGGVVVPLRRDTFVFEEPTRTFYEVPVLGARAGVGVGYEFGDRSPGLRP